MRQQQSVSDDKQTLAGKAAAADTIVEQELSSGQTSNRDKANSDYFLHALYCVILGVVVMIVLFFICKFLNDCQIDPKMRLRGFGREDLLESLPLILDGHMQVRWKMVPTYNCIFIKVLFVPMMLCRCLLWFCFSACESTCPSKYMIHLASRGVFILLDTPRLTQIRTGFFSRTHLSTRLLPFCLSSHVAIFGDPRNH